MMNPIQTLATLAGQLGLASLFTLFFAGLFVYVMTRNYRRMIREEFRPHLLEGEKVEDKINVTGAISATRTVLTDRRVLQLNLSWLFSRRKAFAIAWVDTHSVTFKRSVVWIALVLAALASGRFNPAAFLLVLWGIDSTSYTIVFATPFAQMPLTRVRIGSYERAALPEFARFYRSGQALWARFRGERTLATLDETRGPVVAEASDFRLGGIVWVSVLVVMAAAMVQRVVETHVGFDSIAFGAVFLAAPVAAARVSRRDGRWVALLCFVGLLTVKYPLTGLAGYFGNDGGMPYFAQYVGVLLTLLIASEASAAITRAGRPALSPLAALVWIPYVAIHMPSVALDLGLYARAVAAVGVAALAAVLASVLRDRAPRALRTVGLP